MDAMIPYYPRELKEANLTSARSNRQFQHYVLDLRTACLGPLLEDVDVVFHLAAMPGLAKSWTDFDLYESCNVTATHRLLEASCGQPLLRRFIYASTSSVYGRFSSGDENLPTRPISPYGVTKLAGENLCRAFHEEHGLPLVVLRYFSVYGPRQRPDMGYHRFIAALLEGRPIPVFGDGQQMRGNTYISDCVDATVAALGAPLGETYNVGGGETASVWDILHKLEVILGCRPQVRREASRPGDQRHTCADTGKLQRHLGWQPRVGLDAGLTEQIAWQRLAAFRQAA
jgi:nucleoside-diphosphate-sugar epimerase